MTDILGGAGTALIQLVVGQLIYAEAHNLKPWVHLNNSSKVFYDPLVHSVGGVSLVAQVGRNATHVAPFRQGYRHKRDYIPGSPNSSIPVQTKELYFAGTGVWNSYFEPVSDFVPGDRSCESKLYVTMDLYLITPGIHGFSNSYATRCWRYDYLPDYISKPHQPLHEWLWPQRKLAHDTVTKYIRFKPYLRDYANRVNPKCHIKSNPCLGLHIRHSDKAAGRRVIAVQEFLPYAQAFVEAGGSQIYLATDSSQVVETIQQSWPSRIRSRIRFANEETIMRSSNENAVFDMASHHRINQQALVEILALSQCQFMIHGLSALSESSIWINLDLHHRSVNLEDKEYLDHVAFGELVKLSLQGNTTLEQLPHPPQTDKWWEQLLSSSSPSSTLLTTNAPDRACKGYKGLMKIDMVASEASVGQAFFTSILNQLAFAERFHLRPWINLSCEANGVIHDPVAHRRVNQSVSLPLLGSVIFRNPAWELSNPLVGSQMRSPTLFQTTGCNIWETYFEPLPGPGPKDETCSTVISLTQEQVTHELEVLTPWAIRALSDESAVLRNRKRGSELVSSYFQLKAPILERAQQINPLKAGEDVCLAVDIRLANKNGRKQKKITAGDYLPYMEVFVRAGGNIIFVASDSSRALKYIRKTSSESVRNMIRDQGNFVTRSKSNMLPLHVLDDHHRVNSETLLDIVAMSRCHMLLHGFSAVAEASIYMHLDLHNHSVNLENPGRLSVDSFEQLAGSVVKKQRWKSNN